MLFKCKIRLDATDFNNLAVMLHALENVNVHNTALIFTFADQDREMDREYAKNLFDTLIKGADGLFTIPIDRIFLFKGKDGAESATTSQELQNWVLQMMPLPGQSSFAKHFD